MSSSGYEFRSFRLDRNSQAYKDLQNTLFGIPIEDVEDEKRPWKNFNLKAELLKVLKDEDLKSLLKDEKKPWTTIKAELLKALKALKDKDLESKSQGKDDDLKETPKKKRKIKNSGCCDDAKFLRDQYNRQQRSLAAGYFTKYYKFASGEKICIHPYGPPIRCLSDYCFESTWVGVHGMQSMCIVTRRDDATRLHPFYQKDCLKHQNMTMFARAAISEVECLPHKDDFDYYDVAFRELCTGAVKKPFCVVSMGQDVLEEFCNQDSKLKTINYLDSVVSSDLVHTHYGILRVAITAYQQLMCHKVLRADDIWVTIMEDFDPNCYEHLPIDKIGEQLDIVNGISSEKDPQKPFIIKYCGSLQG